jgi:hypothetical protein
MDIIVSVVVAIIVALLLIYVLDWLGGAVGIPGNIINLLKILVILFLILKLFGMLV